MLFVLILVYIFNFIDRQILSILAEEIKLDLGIRDAEVGFLYGIVFAIFMPSSAFRWGDWRMYGIAKSSYPLACLFGVL